MQPAATEPDGTAEDTRSAPRPGSAAWRAAGLRAVTILVSLQAFAILLQAITAGQLLAGTPGTRQIHSAGAVLILLLSILQVVAATLVWRPGRGPARLLIPSVGILVVVLVQATLGETHNRALHVPLGVLMFAGMASLARQLWSQRGAAGASPTAGATGTPTTSAPATEAGA
jgi:hypothetical protein